MKGSTRLIIDQKKAENTAAPIRGLLDVKTSKLYAFGDYQCNGEPKRSLTIGRARYCDIKLFDTAVSTVRSCLYAATPWYGAATPRKL